MISNKRRNQILDDLCAWIAEHDEEFIQCAIEAADITREEAEYLELVDSGEDDDEEPDEDDDL